MDNERLEEAQRLAKENYALAVFLAKEWNLKVRQLDFNEIQSLTNYGFWKACLTFDKSKGFKFATYAGVCVKNEVLQYLRKIKKDKLVTTFSALEARLDNVTSWEGSFDYLERTAELGVDNISEMIEEENKKYLSEKILNDLVPRERKIIDLRYRHEMTQREISKLMGISQSYISRLENKIMQRMKNKYQRAL